MKPAPPTTSERMRETLAGVVCPMQRSSLPRTARIVSIVANSLRTAVPYVHQGVRWCDGWPESRRLRAGSRRALMSVSCWVARAQSNGGWNSGREARHRDHSRRRPQAPLVQAARPSRCPRCSPRHAASRPAHSSTQSAAFSSSQRFRSAKSGSARSTRVQNAGGWWASPRWTSSWTMTYSMTRGGSRMVFQWK